MNIGLQALKPYTLSIGALILANCVPIFGVLYFKWELFEIVFLYWLESGIILLFSFLKLLTFDLRKWIITPNIPEVKIPKAFVFFFNIIPLLILFLNIIFIYFVLGMFMALYAMAIFNLFGGKELDIFDSSHFSLVFLPEFYKVKTGFWALFLSHGVSFLLNFIGKEEYEKEISKFSPVHRILVMHLTIIFTGFLTMFLGRSTIYILILFILCKILVDVVAHMKERQRV